VSEPPFQQREEGWRALRFGSARSEALQSFPTEHITLLTEFSSTVPTTEPSIAQSILFSAVVQSLVRNGKDKQLCYHSCLCRETGWLLGASYKHFIT